MKDNLLPNSTWLTIEKAQKEFGFSKSWFYKQTASRNLPHYKPCGRIYFLKEELDRWIADAAVPTETVIRSNIRLTKKQKL